MKTFWLIWNPTFPAPPRVRFSTSAEAERVAEDMARQYKQQFFVLKAQKLVETETPVKITVLK